MKLTLALTSVVVAQERGSSRVQVTGSAMVVSQQDVIVGSFSNSLTILDPQLLSCVLSCQW